MLRYKPAKLYDCGGDLSRRWFVQYYVEHPLTGKDIPFRVEKGINHTQSAKERRRIGNGIAAHLNQLLADGALNPFAELAPPAPRQTLLAALQERVDAYNRPPFREKTWRSYQNFLNRLEDFLKERQLHDIGQTDFTAGLARQFSDWLQQSRTGRSINNVVAGLRTLFTQHYDRLDEPPGNPFAKIGKLPEDLKIRRPFTPEHQQALRNWMRLHDPALLLYITLEHDCFIRPIELRSLMIEDILLERRMIRIKASVAKSRREEFVAIPPKAYELLSAARLGTYPPTWYLFGGVGTGMPSVRNGRPAPSAALEPGKGKMGINVANYRHSVALKATGLKQEGYSLYSWKDTGASNADQAGISLTALQKQMRHTDPKITMRYLNRQRQVIAEEFLTFEVG